LENKAESVRWLGDKGIAPAANFERWRAGQRWWGRARCSSREPLPTRFPVFAPAIVRKRRGEIWVGRRSSGRWEAPVVKERAPQAGGSVGHWHSIGCWPASLVEPA
jgi:hypothetical protein